MEEIDDDEGHAEEQSNRHAGRSDGGEEGGSGGRMWIKIRGFLHIGRVSRGLKGLSRSHSTRRSSSRSAGKNRNHDLR